MRLFGLRVGRQAYLRAAGRPSTLTTFRGPTQLDYETLGTPDAFYAPVVYACVSRICRTISQLPRRVRREADNEVLAAPMWVESPNTFQGGNDFIKSLVVSMLLWGEAFIIPARDSRGITRAAAVVNPQYVWHQVQGNIVRWSINGIFFDGEMIHLRNDALPGKVRGYAAENTMHRLTETNLEAQKFIERVVQYGGAYQLGIIFPESADVDEKVVENLARQVMARHSGAENAYRPLVLEGGATIEQLNQSNADGQFIDLQDSTAKAIAQFWFGVDDTMLGFKSDQPQVYQNAPSIYFRYWTFACKHVAGEIERGLSLMLPRGQRFDFEEWDVLLGGPHDRAKLALEMAAVNNTMGVKVFTEDELRKVTGMHPLAVYDPMTITDGGAGANMLEPGESPEDGRGEGDE